MCVEEGRFWGVVSKNVCVKKKEKSEIDGQKFYDVRDDEHTCIHNPRQSVSQCIEKKG